MRDEKLKIKLELGKNGWLSKILHKKVELLKIE
jgi:hypothetical protein